MKRLKGLLIFVLLFISIFFVDNTQSLAASVQYTDNVIPAMTNDTSPSGEASASSYYPAEGIYSAYRAYQAFDHDNSNWNAWVSANTTYGWLAYEFSEEKCITKYTITPRNNDTSSPAVLQQLPRNWTFEAWNEQLNQWVILDTKTNITNWVYAKKEFTFTNNALYKKYRINISLNNGFKHVSIGELEMMETISAPTNLIATSGNGNVNLTWGGVANAQSYVIKRSLISGGSPDVTIPYTPVASGSAITFTDTDVTPGTTYYYVVSSIISGTESPNSNEVSATPTEESTSPGHIGNTATLILTMTNGDGKVYNLSLTDLDIFLTWYDGKSSGTGKSYYVFTKTESVAPYVSVKEYISFDKISSFEVKEYNQ